MTANLALDMAGLQVHICKTGTKPVWAWPNCKRAQDVPDASECRRQIGDFVSWSELNPLGDSLDEKADFDRRR